LAFIHAFSWHLDNILDAWRTAIRSRSMTCPARLERRTRPGH
jgi:hypothetical protein